MERAALCDDPHDLWIKQCIAPKSMDMIVRYITQELSGVDNYVDDLLAPAHDAKDVAAALTTEVGSVW